MVGQISSTLTITLKKQAENYTIEASGSKGIKVDPQLVPQLKTLLSDQQITDTLKDLSSKTAPATTDAIQKLGKALYDSLFADRDLLLAFGKVQGSASAGSGARLRLQIEPTELAALPWETLHDGKDWLSTQGTTPLVRKLPLSNDRKALQKLQVRGALRILFVGASPEDLDPLKVEETADELETLLAAPIRKKQIAFNKLLDATLEELRQELLKDYHILYFAGHGSPEGIFLDDGQGDDIEKDGKVIGRERGDKSLVSAETLAEALKGKQTRLVFLAACETSKASKGSRLLRGFAQELAERSNLPAIVAMQYFISDMQANPLTTQFFAALAAGRPVDVAMAEARSVLMKKGQVNRDVFSPVLYLQAEDGALFPIAKNWPAISLGVAFLIAAIVGGIFARSAVINHAKTTAQTLATQAESIRGTSGASLVKSLLLSVQSLKEQPTIEGDQALRRGLALLPHSKTCTANGDKIIAVSFGPDGKYFASISSDKTVRVWETINCHLLTSWIEDEKKFFGEVGAEISNISISLSSDGKYIGIGGNTILRVRNVRSHQKIADINPGFSIDKLSISPDGKYIAVATRKIAQIWEIALHRKIGNDYFYNDEEISEITNIALSNLGKHLAVIFDGDDGTFLDINNVKEATHQTIFVSGQSLIMSFSPDGEYLATAGDDFDLDGNNIALIKIFKDDAEWKEVATLRQDEIPEFIAFSSHLKMEVEGGINNQYFATGSKSTSRIWKIDALGRTELIALIPSENPLALAFSPNAEFLNIVSSKENNDKSKPSYVTMNKWQVNSNSQILTVNPDFGPRNYIETLAFSSDGKTLTGRGSEKQNSWKMKDGENFISRPLDLGSASSPSISPDGKFIAWNFLDTFYWMNLANGQPKKFSLPQRGISIGPIAISSEGKYLAVASGKVVSLLNRQNITQSLSLSLPENVIAVTFSLDGDFLATATKNIVDIWKCYKNSCYTFKRISLKSEIERVALSKDGKYLAIVSGKIAEVHQVSNTQIIARIENNLTLNAVAFSWDDRYLATANKNLARTITSEDSIAKVWLLMPQDLSQEACSRLIHNLTPLEWLHYCKN